MKYSVEAIKPDPANPHLGHNCTRGRCNHRGQYKVIMGHKKVQVCKPHASEFCKRHGLHLPPEEV